MHPSKKRKILVMKRAGFTEVIIARDMGMPLAVIRAVLADARLMPRPPQRVKQPPIDRSDPELTAAVELAKEGHPTKIIFKSFIFNDVGRGIVEQAAKSAVDRKRKAGKD